MLEALGEARRLGFLGPGPVEFHVAHAVGFAEAVEERRHADGLAGPPAGFLDLGTGGGIPGLVLAARWPEAAAVLLDASEVRTDTLASAISALGWDGRVRIVRARAEVAGRSPELRHQASVVVARGFGSPPVLAECAGPLLAVGGLLVVSEPPFDPSGAPWPPGRTGPLEAPPASGPGAWDARRWPSEASAQLGLRPLNWYHHGFGYQVLRQEEPCPDRFPRREGMPAKRPLWRA